MDRIEIKPFTALVKLASVQALRIILMALKTKVVAVYLGASGVGLVAILNNIVQVFETFAGLGLKVSAIKFFASNDEKGRNRVFNNSFTLLVTSGILASFVIILFRKQLSTGFFGTSKYDIWISLLPLAIISNLISGILLARLQGERMIGAFVKVNRISIILGVFAVILSVVLLGESAIILLVIVPAIILLLVALWRTDYHPKLRYNLYTVLEESKKLVLLGFSLSIGSVISFGSLLVFRSYLTRFSTTDMLGFYSMGATIVLVYVGLVFNSVGADYFPRISKLCGRNDEELTRVVNHQIELMLTLIVPIILFMLVFLDFILEVLYSAEFLAASEFVGYFLISVLPKVFGWCIGFLLLGFARNKLFILSEFLSSLLFIVFNVSFFEIYGLRGLGYSSILINILHIFLVSYLTKFSGIKINKDLWTRGLVMLLLFLLMFHSKNHDLIVIYSFLVLAILLVSLARIRRNSEIVDYISAKVGKQWKK